jgi:hypothetical protein
MASAFRNIIDFFSSIGVFDVVMPFLLIFTVVFAIFERTKVFGIEKIDGKEYSKKNLNSAASFVIAFLVVASSELVEIITKVSSQFVVLLFLVVLFLLLAGSFFKEEPSAFFLEKGGWRTTFLIIVFLGISFIFLDALGLIEKVFGFVSGRDQGVVIGSVILLGLIVAFIIYVTSERKNGGSSSGSATKSH